MLRGRWIRAFPQLLPTRRQAGAKSDASIRCCAARAGGEGFLLDYLAERKSVADLVGSIKDGRFLRQKAAMAASGLRRLLYVVEGEPNTVGCESSCTNATA